MRYFLIYLRLVKGNTYTRCVGELKLRAGYWRNTDPSQTCANPTTKTLFKAITP